MKKDATSKQRVVVWIRAWTSGFYNLVSKTCNNYSDHLVPQSDDSRWFVITMLLSKNIYRSPKCFFLIIGLRLALFNLYLQVSPAELEAVILLHPSVKDVGVIGTPDPMAGELPTAFVVKKPGANISEDELKEFVAAKVIFDFARRLKRVLVLTS